MDDNFFQAIATTKDALRKLILFVSAFIFLSLVVGLAGELLARFKTRKHAGIATRGRRTLKEVGGAVRLANRFARTEDKNKKTGFRKRMMMDSILDSERNLAPEKTELVQPPRKKNLVGTSIVVYVSIASLTGTLVALSNTCISIRPSSNPALSTIENCLASIDKSFFSDHDLPWCAAASQYGLIMQSLQSIAVFSCYIQSLFKKSTLKPKVNEVLESSIFRGKWILEKLGEVSASISEYSFSIVVIWLDEVAMLSLLFLGIYMYSHKTRPVPEPVVEEEYKEVEEEESEEEDTSTWDLLSQDVVQDLKGNIDSPMNRSSESPVSNSLDSIPQYQTTRSELELERWSHFINTKNHLISKAAAKDKKHLEVMLTSLEARLNEKRKQFIY